MPEEIKVDQRWLRYLPVVVRRRIEGRHELQQIIDNTGWLVGDRLLRMAVGLLISIWTARYLGPSDYGLLSYAVSFVGLFFAGASLGLEAIVTRDLVRYPEQQDQILGTSFLLRLGGGGAAAALALLVILLLKPAEPLVRLLVAITSIHLMLQAFEVIDLWFQSQVRSRSVVLAKNVAFLGMAAVRVLLLVNGAPVVAFAVANIVEITFGYCGLLVAYRRQGKHPTAWRFCRSTAMRFLQEGMPIILSSMMVMVYLRIDQVMIGQYAGSQEVGRYAAAVKLAEIWNLIPVVIVSSVFPNIIRSREQEERLFLGKLQKLYNLLSFCSYAVAVPLSLGAYLLITLLYGVPYASAAPMLILLLWAGLFANLAVARNAYLLTMGWSRVILALVVAGALTNVGLNLLLIPRFGGIGAGIASLVSYWVVAHGGCYLYRPLRVSARMLSHALLHPRFW